MTDGSASLPADFRQITAAPPQGWELSSRVVQPEIRIRKEGAGFALHVAGTKTVRGEKKVWDAPGPDYNWVADGNVIRPLPHNTPAIVRQMLGGQLPKTLSFPDVVRLVRLGNPDIPVIAEESVFHSAQSAAADLRPDQDIPGLHATLFPYQAQGVAWMDQTIRHTGGLILADEMGLGKTIQIIALLLCEKPETSRPALIICPTSLIANWRKEIMKFAPELSVLIHRGHNRTGITAGLQRAQVVLSTYDTVVNDISIFAGMPWSWLICDEAQALKNPDSGRRQAVGRIPRQRTIPMTGTPVETSLLDLWSLADLAIPGLLGSREDFEADHPDSEESAKNLARLTIFRSASISICHSNSVTSFPGVMMKCSPRRLRSTLWQVIWSRQVSCSSSVPIPGCRDQAIPTGIRTRGSIRQPECRSSHRRWSAQSPFSKRRSGADERFCSSQFLIAVARLSVRQHRVGCRMHTGGRSMGPRRRKSGRQSLTHSLATMGRAALYSIQRRQERDSI